MKETQQNDSSKKCYHCGDKIWNHVVFDEKRFCCNGCKTVYQLLLDSGMLYYYDLQPEAGTPPLSIGKFDYLENEEVANSLLDFNEGGQCVINFDVPSIHCSSCIWILENLRRLNQGIWVSYVHFAKKRLKITFDKSKVTLLEVAKLLNRIGYPPRINLGSTKNTQKSDKKLYYQLGVAAFSFGNIMLLSFPEYFESQGFWIDKFKPFFRLLIAVLAFPVLIYSAKDYFLSAYTSIKTNYLSIDFPIALGLLTMVTRSLYEITTNTGSGYFDSLTGLVFFLLLGKLFQQKTYNFLSFERDYKSYFPISVCKKVANKEYFVPIEKVKEGEHLYIRNQEVIPIDCVLLSKATEIDYSFVTGESRPIEKRRGENLFAGGKNLSEIIEVKVFKKLNNSYLTELWNNHIIKSKKPSLLHSITAKIANRFTYSLLIVAILSSIFWTFYDFSNVFNVFTAVLIVACPCALALSGPFTYGYVLRYLGYQKFYVKSSEVLENLQEIDTVVFDKTGTLTKIQKSKIDYIGQALTEFEKSVIRSVLNNSLHPLSRALYTYFESSEKLNISQFKNHTGQGISAMVKGRLVSIGSADYLKIDKLNSKVNYSQVYISIDNQYKGCFFIENTYRKGVFSLLKKLAENKEIHILSGDNASEQSFIEKNLRPTKVSIKFNQTPTEKLVYIKKLRKLNKKVLMIGDGLNDAGALYQSNVGVSITDNLNVFTPASDVIYLAMKLKNLTNVLTFINRSKNIIKHCLVLSILYNVFGLTWAISGKLEPVFAAILMPFSSISIVIFTWIATKYSERILRRKVI